MDNKQDKVFLKTAEIAYKLNISKSKFYEIKAEGKFGLKPIKIDGIHRYSSKEFEKYIDRSTSEGRLLTFKEWQSESKGGNK